MLYLLYSPDTDTECKEHVREFLEVLHDGAAEGMDIGNVEDDDQVADTS